MGRRITMIFVALGLCSSFGRDFVFLLWLEFFFLTGVSGFRPNVQDKKLGFLCVISILGGRATQWIPLINHCCYYYCYCYIAAAMSHLDPPLDRKRLKFLLSV